jgi:outer membrane immunogenic protein
MKATLLASAALSLLTVSAFGADMQMPPLKAPLAPPPFTWTGCYAGGQAGGGWGQKDLNDSVGIVSAISDFTSASLSISGYMLGGQIGCDYQFASNWVVGVEGAASGGSIGGSTSVATPDIAGDGATFKETTDLLTSVTARVGYTWDRWMVYAKGGAAWASDRYSAFDVLGNYDFEGLETRFGWTAGAGVEWALWNDWSLKLEYDYYGFGTRSVTFIDNVSSTVGPLDIKQNIQVIKLGVNFHVYATSAPLGW